LKNLEVLGFAVDYLLGSLQLILHFANDQTI